MNQNHKGNSQKYLLIYNPNAGKKRSFLHFHTKPSASLEQVKFLLEKYQIIVELAPTKGPGHATQLAREAAKKGYKGVLVAGGDGTVGETANGLIDSDMPLGILPFGSFMNTAKMLSVPFDLEKAVQVIKIGRIRKIDVGIMTAMNGKKLAEPHYFLESSSIGLEAQLHENVRLMEKGDLWQPFKALKTFIDFYAYPVDVEIDGKIIRTRASAVIVANGAVSGASLELVDKAKLNDHRLTVSIYTMSKYELVSFFIRLIYGGKKNTRKIKTYQGEKISIKTRYPRLVHADARIFGESPVEYEIKPNAIAVISGFPDPGESFLNARTLLDP